MFTRRRFLLTLPALAALPRLALDSETRSPSPIPSSKKPLAPPPPTFVYFGTDTAKGVSQGHLSLPLRPRRRPSHRARRWPPKPCARPTSRSPRPPTAIAASTPSMQSPTPPPPSPATSWTPPPARCSQINQVTSAGAGPCYVSLDATGQAAFVANYAGSTIATYRVLPDGSALRAGRAHRLQGPPIRHTAAQSPPARTSPTPTPSISRPTTASCWSTTSAPTQISVFPVDPGTPASARPRSSPTTAPAPARATSPSIPTAAGSTPSTSSTPPSTTSSGPPPARAPTPRACSSTPATHVKTIAPGFPAAKNTAAEVAISPDGNYPLRLQPRRRHAGRLRHRPSRRRAHLRPAHPLRRQDPAPLHPLARLRRPLAPLRQPGLRHRHRLPPRRRLRPPRRPHPDPPPRLRHVHPLRVSPQTGCPMIAAGRKSAGYRGVILFPIRPPKSLPPYIPSPRPSV